jgi:hypothetical protein
LEAGTGLACEGASGWFGRLRWVEPGEEKQVQLTRVKNNLDDKEVNRIQDGYERCDSVHRVGSRGIVGMLNS